MSRIRENLESVIPMNTEKTLYGSIEIGGTKINCAVAETKVSSNSLPSILFEKQIKTQNPLSNINDILEFFKPHKIQGLGVGSFGPIELNKNSKTYGTITTTPKLEWRNFDLFNTLQKHFNCKIYIDTDVNIAALAEGKWGRGKELNSCLYLTIGTGIGGGMFLDDRLLHGLFHPEMGHIIIRKHPEDHFKGVCPHHQDCLEGLSSGFSIEKRFRKKAELLNNKERAFIEKIISYYLAQAITNYILILCPKIIILGGGVMTLKGLVENKMNNVNILKKIQLNVKNMLNNYINKNELNKNIDEYIVFPGLGHKSGIFGGFALCVFEKN